MSYLFGVLVIILFFSVLHYFTALDHKQKALVTLIMVAIIGAAIVFNEHSDAQSRHVADIELKYRQDKNVACEEIVVNRKNFSYSVGTRTFIGREGTEHFNRMISASQCR